MKKTLKTAMITSISDVLETMFFITIEATEVNQWADLDIDVSGGTHYVSKIDFSGPLTGFFILVVPQNILSDMTEFFMGIDAEEITEAQLSGTISEAINMIAGNAFSILDDQAVFNLEIPELLDAQSLQASSGQTENEALYLRIETPSGRLGLQAQYYT